MQCGGRGMRLRRIGAAVIAVLCLGGCSDADGTAPADEPGASGPGRHPLAAPASAPTVPGSPVPLSPAVPGHSRAGTPAPGAAAPSGTAPGGATPDGTTRDRHVARGDGGSTVAGAGDRHTRPPQATGPAHPTIFRDPVAPASLPDPASTILGDVLDPAPVPSTSSAPPRRRPPGWISKFVELSDEPDTECTWIKAGATNLRIKVERLEPLTICVKGYARTTSPRLRFSAAGDERVEPGRLSGRQTWAWDVQPGAEGDTLTEIRPYHFEIAGQPDERHTDTLLTSGRIVVARSTELRLAFTDDRGPDEPALRPGQSLRARLAGYRPGRTVIAAVYRESPKRSGWRFVADLPDMVMDDSGEGRLRWVVPSGIRAGDYAIWLGPGSAGDRRWELMDFFEVDD